jgi:dolichol-phosphate mannosyltransferase
MLNLLSQKYNNVFYISFVRNFGHQQALKAGLDIAKGSAVISIDGDHQHPPHLLPQMIEAWENGYKVVIMQRIDTHEIGFFKKQTSALFYRFFNKISNIKLNQGESDFRLLDREVVDVFKQMNHRSLFIRGLVRMLGYPAKEIQYEVAKRRYGKSKYSVKKMISLAINGIMSISEKPLYFVIYVGMLSLVVGVLTGIYSIASFLGGFTIKGWTSTLMIISFFSGIQIMMLGIIGLYVGRVFAHSLNQPSYLIGQTNYNK